MTKAKSPLDELYYEIYGEYPPKSGQAYERLVAAAFKVLLGFDVAYDQRKRGLYSDTVYQLDSMLQKDGEESMVEVKDYTIDKRPVGRDDLQKMQGALTDLAVTKGLFASATNYTGPAKKYAESSKLNPAHKEVDLFHVRPSTIEDEQGRVKTIVINMKMIVHDYANAQFKPIWTNKGEELLKLNGYEGKTMSLSFSQFFKPDRSIYITIPELTKEHPPMPVEENGYRAKGCWVLDGASILVSDEFYEIKGLEYEVPFNVHEDVITIESEGQAKLFVKSEDGKIDKLVSDFDLRKLKFVNGEVIS
jgi:hypothetical protein